LGVLAVLHIRRATHPILDFLSLKIKTYAVSIIGGSIFRTAISVSPFLLPLMFQVGFGLNAFQSGLLVFALFAGNFAMKSVTTPILRRFGFRKTLLVNGVATAAAILACATLTPHTPRILILGILFVNGLCRSMQFTSVNTLAFVDVPRAQLSSATTLASMAQQMSMGMGVAVGAIALRVAALITGHAGASPTIAQFHIAFVLVAIIALLAVLDCIPLDPHAGAEVSGHRIRSFQTPAVETPQD
jgi:MFS family permease